MQCYKSESEVQAMLQKGWVVLWKAGDVKRTKGLPSDRSLIEQTLLTKSMQPPDV